MDTFEILGSQHGDTHIIRNAGGAITDDVIRSLCFSQRFLGTRETVLLGHTDCDLKKVTEDDCKAGLEAEIGTNPWWALKSFADPHADALQSIKRLQMTPFIHLQDHIRGYGYSVASGLLEEVIANNTDVA